MSTNKIEFAVQMTCDSCVHSVKKSLENVQGIKSVDVNLQTGSVVVDSNLPTLDIQEKIELTGRKVVVKGYDGSIAGVSVLDTGAANVKGVVRFVQVTPNTCIIDGTVDGLQPGTHQISVHECGDISEGCKSLGDIYNNPNTNHNRISGDLGTITAEKTGRVSFRLEDNVINLSDIIGRSLVISDKNNRIACGIIARSAGLFQNPKTICACDGVSIWDETSKPKYSML